MNGYGVVDQFYDRCAYKGCDNGKSTGHHLFRFPDVKDPRQRIWIERSSENGDRLRSWSASTLRRAGLCGVHFASDSFVIGNNTKLIPQALPLSLAEKVDEIINIDEAMEYVSEMDDIQLQSKIVDFTPSSDCNTELQDHSYANIPDIAISNKEVPVKTYGSGKLSFFEEDDDDNLQWMALPSEQPDISTRSEGKVNSENTLEAAMEQIAKLQKANRSLTRQNDLLRRHMRRLRDRLREISERNQPGIRKRRGKKPSVDDFLDGQNCTQPAARTMVKLQLHVPGMPYSPEERDLAKQLYYHSAAAFSRLRKGGCNFPGESTVRRWVAEYDIRCGFSDCIFEILTDKLRLLPPDQRVCALKFDEMKLKACEEYSTMLDCVEGLADLGPLGRTNERASSLFVFCLDSINAKNSWRQIIAFFLAATVVKAPQIKELVCICLDKLKAVGADVRILTCDQGPSNKTALTSPLYFNISEQDPMFEYNGSTYCASFDFPHLIKRLLYHLRTYNKLYCDGEVIVAFEDFVTTWELDASQNSSNLLGHISDVHLFPVSMEAMNVKRAFQVLSHTFASAIRLAGADPKGLKSTTWEASASFAERLNDVIDAHNAYRLIFANPMRRPLSPRNPAIEKTLTDFADWVSKWSQSPNKIQRPPCFTGLVITARAIVKTYHQVAEDFPGFELAAGLCNQDSVEHLFSKLRQRGGHNPNPTARMARLGLRHIISTGYIHSGDNGNVQCPEAEALITPLSNVARVFNESDEPQQTLPYEEVAEIMERQGLSHDVTLLDAHGGLVIEETTDSDTSLYKSNAVTFFAGYIAFRSQKKKPCEKCRNDMTKTPMDASTADEIYIEYKEYDNLDVDAPKVMKLTRPTDLFRNIVDIQLSAFTATCDKHWSSCALMKYMVEELTKATQRAFPQWLQPDDPCVGHRIEALKYLIRVKVYAKTRSNNQAAKMFKTTGHTGNSQKQRKLKILKSL